MTETPNWLRTLAPSNSPFPLPAVPIEPWPNDGPGGKPLPKYDLVAVRRAERAGESR